MEAGAVEARRPGADLRRLGRQGRRAGRQEVIMTCAFDAVVLGRGAEAIADRLDVVGRGQNVVGARLPQLNRNANGGEAVCRKGEA